MCGPISNSKRPRRSAIEPRPLRTRIALALFAVSTLWRDTRVRLLAALAGAALLYALGHNSVFQGVLYGLIPQLDKARSPSAVVVLFKFAAGTGTVRHINRGYGDGYRNRVEQNGRGEVNHVNGHAIVGQVE